MLQSDYDDQLMEAATELCFRDAPAPVTLGEALRRTIATKRLLVPMGYPMEAPVAIDDINDPRKRILARQLEAHLAAGELAEITGDTASARLHYWQGGHILHDLEPILPPVTTSEMPGLHN